MPATRARASLLSLAPLVALLATDVARAADATDVARAADATVVVPGAAVVAPVCPIAPLSTSDFIDALRVELAGRAATATRTLVTLAIEPCDVGTTTVHVTLTDEAGATSSTRDVDLADVAAPARPRALALVVAELVRAAAVRAPTPPPAPAAARPGGDPERVGPATTPPARTIRATFGAEALGRVFPSRDTAQWGGRLSLGDEQPGWHWELFVEGATGGRHVDAGDLVVRSLGAGYAIGFVNALGRTRLRSAFALSFDDTRVAGASPAPGVVARGGHGLTVALGLRLALALPLGDAWSLHVFAEPGYVLRHLDADVDASRAAGVGGTVISFGLGGVYGRR